MTGIKEGRRKKKKNKLQEKKEHPYKRGGKFRSGPISGLENKSKEVVNKKRRKKN